MKRVFYAGTEFVTTDAVAEELIHLAEELANHQRAGTVVVPGLRPDDQVDEFTIVIGPSSQIVINNDVSDRTIDAEEAAQSLHDRRLRLEHPAPSTAEAGPADTRTLDEF